MITPNQIKLIAAAVGALALIIGSAVITHKVDTATLLKQQMAWKDAQAKAVEQAQRIQKAEDKVSLDAAVKEATAQQKIILQTATIKQEVSRYVPSNSKCPVTVGFIRVLDAAVLGLDPADVPNPAGKSDDACADVDARTLALNVIANYGACNANAEQLGALQRWVKDTITASKTK